MSQVVSIKQLRQNLAHFTDLVANGESIIVIRRSVPAFKIIPIDKIETDDKWETLIDFTDNGKKKGIPAKNLLKTMQDFEKKYS